MGHKSLIAVSLALTLGSDCFFSQAVAQQFESGNTPPETARNRVKFPKKKLLIGAQRLTVEIAETAMQQRIGLMHRKRLSDKEGMLFVYSKPARLSFWMKSTLIPLSVGFFNKDRELIEIVDMEVDPILIRDKKRPRYRSKGNAKYALEVPKGWFQKYKIRADSGITFELK